MNTNLSKKFEKIVSKNNLSETELDNWTPTDMKAATSTQFASKQDQINCHLPSDLLNSSSVFFVTSSLTFI